MTKYRITDTRTTTAWCIVEANSKKEAEESAFEIENWHEDPDDFDHNYEVSEE